MTLEEYKEHTALIEKAYRLFNARKMHEILRLMIENVVWPNGMDGGYVYGHAGVREYWSRQWQMINPNVQPVSFDMGENDSLIVLVHQVVKDLNGNILIDQMIQHVYSFSGGLIQKMDIVELKKTA